MKSKVEIQDNSVLRFAMDGDVGTEKWAQNKWRSSNVTVKDCGN
jgi:hypothetical protein